LASQSLSAELTRSYIATKLVSVVYQMSSLSSGAAVGSVRAWLRTEGLAALVLALFLYTRGGYSWRLFAVLILAPDLSFAGYLAGARLGAATYNTLHSYVGPLVLAVVLLAAGRPADLPLIWAAHIGFDRLVGYGLKYPSGFGDTHLGAIGRPSGSAA
jgi:hypothetical protein